jgi:hypothetical protein
VETQLRLDESNHVPEGAQIMAVRGGFTMADLLVSRYQPAEGKTELGKFVEGQAFQLAHRGPVRQAAVVTHRIDSAHRRARSEGGGNFFGVRVIRFASDPSQILACYTLGLDNQEFVPTGRLVHAYCADLLIDKEAGAESGLAQLVLGLIEMDGQIWGTSCGALRTVGTFISKLVFGPELGRLGFRQIASDVRTRCYGPCELWVKDYGQPSRLTES